MSIRERIKYLPDDARVSMASANAETICDARELKQLVDELERLEARKPYAVGERGLETFAPSSLR
jgi:hypothetical protein